MEEYSNDSDDLYDRIDDDLEPDNNAFGDDEAEEDNKDEEAPQPKVVKVKKPVLRPQPKLNLQTLQGPNGILALNELFKKFKFRGGGHEEEDYGNIVRLLEQWSYRLFPKFHFEDTLKRLEALGKKREIQAYLRKVRSGMADEVVRNFDDDVIENEDHQMPDAADDVFDELLSQQIAQAQLNTPSHPRNHASYSPASARQTPSQAGLSDEQKARIERNKQFALAKRMEKQRELEISQSQMESPMDTDN